MKIYLGLVFSHFFSLFFLLFLFFSPFFSSLTGFPSQMRTKCDIWFGSWPIYSLIFILIAIKSSSTLILQVNFFYFNFWHPIFSNYGFHLLFGNLQFYPCSNINSGLNHLSFRHFILNNNSQKHYNFTWYASAPLQLHVLYTLSRRGVTPTMAKTRGANSFQPRVCGTSSPSTDTSTPGAVVAAAPSAAAARPVAAAAASLAPATAAADAEGSSSMAPA